MAASIILRSGMIRMTEAGTEPIQQLLSEIYRIESRRVFATLIRLLGDFDLAEEALHDAFVSAAEQWPASGVPANPRAWLVSAGRFKAIDALRRRARFDASLDAIARRVDELADEKPGGRDEEIEDDRLRLIFTCCHPGAGVGHADRSHAARSLRFED